MRFRLRHAAMVGGAALFLVGWGARAQLPVAQAAQTWNVQAGGDIQGGNLAALTYFPSVVTVNAGDTVTWSFPGALEPHTVTFDNGHFPSVFVLGVSTPGPNPGDVDTSAPFLPLNFTFPSTTFDPTAQINIPADLADPPGQRPTGSLVFTKPGVYHYECALHSPEMSGTVVVQAAGAQLNETPAQATTRGQGEIAEATGNAAGTLQAIGSPMKTNSLTLANGQTIFDVGVGAQLGAHTAALQFFPADLTVKRGDTVVFDMNDATELHTVTFTSGGPDPDFVDVTPQPNGPPKLIFPASVVMPQGGNVYTGSGLLHSGFMDTKSSFIVTINAPAGTYMYHCMVHEGMEGTITVQ